MEAFEEWVSNVASGAEIFSGSRLLRLSDEARAAIVRLRDRIQAEHRAKVARLMQQWMTAAHEGEPAFEPDDIEPFRSTDLDARFVEAA